MLRSLTLAPVPALILMLCARPLGAQTLTPMPPPSPAVTTRATSITLAQIVARQKANYDRIQNARGQVYWTERRAGVQTAAAGVPDERVIYFAFEPGRRVNLVLPASEAPAYVQGQGRINWSNVLSAVAIQDDVVQTISQPPGASVPEVQTVLYNPAVHEANPLVAFHPRLLGDERVTLTQLAASAPRMASPPRLSEIQYAGRTAVRIDFSNPSVPGEAVYYIVDPARACLPMEIGRISGGRLASLTRIVIGHTKDGTWIPARREKATYDASGRVVASESWYYHYLSVNEGLSRKGATLAFFHLPEGTRFASPTVTSTPADAPGR